MVKILDTKVAKKGGRPPHLTHGSKIEMPPICPFAKNVCICPDTFKGGAVVHSVTSHYKGYKGFMFCV